MKRIYAFYLFSVLCITVSNAQVWKLYTNTNGLVNNSIKGITIDQSGNVWIAISGGVSMYNGTSFTNYTTVQGLSSNNVRNIVCDNSGIVWVGTQNGLNKINGSNFIIYNTTSGLPSNVISTICPDAGGILWIGTSSSGFSKFDGTSFINYNTTNGLISNSITSFCLDLTGNLWIGTYSGISVFDGTTFTNYTTGNGLPSNSIKALQCDATGNLWIGTASGLVKYNGSTFTTITTFDGLINNSISSIGKDNSGNIWIGYNDYGITKYDGITFTNFTRDNGFNWNYITSFQSFGNLIYTGTPSGLVEFKKWITPPLRFAKLDTNNISAGINACGLLFETPEWNPGFNVPKSTDYSSIFASSVWMGGFDQYNNLHLAAQKFFNFQNDTWTGPLFADMNIYQDDSLWNRIWKISKSEIDYHILNYNQPGYIVPSSISEWPAPTADYIDVNANNLYDPQNGDYPLIRGDQAILTIFNDLTGIHGSGGLPLGVEVHSLSYSFNSTDSALANTVFTNYKIYNYSSNDYSDFYLGIYSDLDIGYATDDYIGCDSINSLYFGYNGDAIDADYGIHIPAQGVVFLSSQMYSFNYFNQFTFPQNSIEIYNVLNGYWYDDTPYTYGGNGYGGINQTNYCYSGDPNNPNGWSQVTENNSPGDIMGLGTVGPFTLLAGKTLCIDVAFPNAISYTGNQLNSVSILKERTSQIINFYNSQSWDCGEIFTDTNTVAHIYSQDTSICKGQNYHINNILVGGAPPYTYNWSPSTGLSNDTILNPVASPMQTTEYIITVTDHQNHTTIDTILITVLEPLVNAGNDTTICNNESLILSATPGFVSYTWLGLGSGQSIIVNSNHNLIGTENFVVTIFDNMNCTSKDTIAVTFLPSPDVNFGTDTILCNTETLLLDAVSGVDNYLWNTGATSYSIIVDGTTLPLGNNTFFVHAWNNNNCHSYDTINVDVQICSTMEELARNGFKIYPNPSEGIFFIESSQDYTLKITEIKGDVVLQKQFTKGTEKFMLNELSKGIYILEIITNQNNIKTKLILD